MVSPDSIFPYAVALAGGLAAGFERWKSSKVSAKTIAEKETVSDAKRQEERGNLMAKMADEYKGLLEKEYAAHQETRNYWHGKASEFQSDLSKCNEKCAELSERTDITKVEKLLLAQGSILQTLGEGIHQLLTKHKP